MALEKTRLTVEDFDAFVRQPQNAERAFEFIAGEVVEMVASSRSSEIAMLIGALITIFVRQRQLGRVTGADGGYVVMNERYIPDVAFIALARQPQPVEAAYNPNAPDLAVEVLSPTNDPRLMRIKIVNYLRAGTAVWLVNPERSEIEVYIPDAAPRTLTIGDTLEGGAILPGFSLPLKDVFGG